MTVILLIIIYIAFISLGLPDSLLGTMWPAMRMDWGLPVDAAGIIPVITTVSGVLSSLFSGKISKWIGTGKVVFISCLLTGGAIMGISFAPSFIWLIVLTIPLGLGAGAVDASLNHYVAVHFKAHHMNWLHSFWGIGATLGPMLISGILASGAIWRTGYRTIGSIQLFLALILLVSLPLWNKMPAPKKSLESEEKVEEVNQPSYKVKGVPYAVAIFMFYCATELSIGLWGSSYLIQAKGLSIDRAAFFVALYFGGITIGRILSGFVSFKLGNKQMLAVGMGIALSALILMLLPLEGAFVIIPLLLLGLGLAPVFPTMIHETPKTFGEKHSHNIIGYQMAAAYLGTAIMPPLFGVFMDVLGLNTLPLFLLGSWCVVIFSAYRLLGRRK